MTHMSYVRTLLSSLQLKMKEVRNVSYQWDRKESGDERDNSEDNCIAPLELGMVLHTRLGVD